MPKKTLPEYLMKIDPGVPLKDIEILVEKVHEHLRDDPRCFTFALRVGKRRYQVHLEPQPLDTPSTP